MTPKVPQQPLPQLPPSVPPPPVIQNQPVGQKPEATDRSITMNRSISALILYLTLTAGATAQSLGPSTLSGNEVWPCSINGPQGPSAFCSAIAVKNYVNSTGAFSLVS